MLIWRPYNQTRRLDAPRIRRRLVILLAATSLALVGLDCSADAGVERREETTGGPSSNAESDRLVRLSREQPLMGTTFRITVLAPDQIRGSRAIDAAFSEIERVEHLISGWESTSELSAVNRAAGEKPVRVGPELMELVETSLRLSAKTEGAFDITFAGCGSLWSFRKPDIPSPSALAACRGKIGFERIELDTDDSTVFLPESDMEIGVGGIGKGYGVDRAAETLEKQGVTNYIVDGGGDVRVRADDRERPWRVGVAHPRQRGRLLGQLAVREGAVVSSGDYERYFERDGKRYHHILDPKTARPARKAVAVTVLSDRTAAADALSTGLFVMGPEEGLELAERMPDVEAMIIDPELEVHATEGFESRFQTQPRALP